MAKKKKAKDIDVVGSLYEITNDLEHTIEDLDTAIDKLTGTLAPKLLTEFQQVHKDLDKLLDDINTTQDAVVNIASALYTGDC